MAEPHATSQELVERLNYGDEQIWKLEDQIKKLDERLKAVEERRTYRIRLSKAQLFKLETGDVVIFKLQTPLATSETEKLVNGWRELMAASGHPEVQAMFLTGGMPEISVLRPEAALA